jgi:exonuclease III
MLNWNVRGLNDAAHRELVRQTVTSARPTIVCLQETKISMINTNLARDTLGPFLDSYVELGAQGTRGGILLAWDKDMVSVTQPVNRSFTISAMVQLQSNSPPFLLTTCYGPADDSHKEEFLAELRSIKPTANIPWMIIGDFNLIYQAADKSNLNLNRRLMGKFRRALDDCELMELSLQNRKYTWSNERENPTLVRLDKAFCTAEWEMAFPNFALSALATGASDHCPLILNHRDRVVSRASFRFENHWLKIDGFHQIVQEAWSKPQTGSAHSVLNKKLTETARALRRWSKPLFSNARLQLHMANEVIFRLDTAQEDRQLSEDELQLRRDLKIRILGLAALERSRRRQASRINYIKAGDACTRFFHLRMAARKRRQYIPTLKRLDGSLVWKHEDKQQVVQAYFQKLIGTKECRGHTIRWDNINITQL